MKKSRMRLAGAAFALAATVPLVVPSIPVAAERGPVTGLTLPRYVSLKAPKANVRRGPGLTHRVDWVFMRRGMPLQIIAEHGHWRRVRDMDDAMGWIHYTMLRGDRTAVVVASRTEFRADASEAAVVTARAEQGVIVSVEACGPAWCEVEAEGAGGWAPKTAIWGVGEAETFD